MIEEQSFTFGGLDDDPPRIILYLGKGGVGKTTTAAATALRCAELGYSTLVTSTDVAHSLGDALGLPLGPEPQEIAENLWAQEISAIADLDAHWGRIQQQLAGMLTTDGVRSIAADELSVVPGMDEIVSLIHIRRQAAERKFDCVVVDAAPTGETVRLLTVPDTFRWYAARLGRLAGPMTGLMRPVAEKLRTAPTELFEVLERFDAAAAELRATLSDPRVSSYRVVVQPEKIVVREARRALSYLALFDYPVDAVVVNRVLPDSASDPFLSGLRDIQQRYLAEIDQDFAPIPRFRTPYYGHEVVGLDALRSLAHDCFADEDPAAVFYTGRPQRIVDAAGGGHVVEIPLPFVGEGDVDLRKRDDELFIRIGNVKREMLLPRALARQSPVGAAVRGDTLSITFRPS